VKLKFLHLIHIAPLKMSQEPKGQSPLIQRKRKPSNQALPEERHTTSIAAVSLENPEAKASIAAVSLEIQ